MIFSFYSEDGTEEYSMSNPYRTIDHALYNVEELYVTTIYSALELARSYWSKATPTNEILNEKTEIGRLYHEALRMVIDHDTEHLSDVMHDVEQLTSAVRIDVDGESGMTLVTVPELWVVADKR